jgi:hypothetical protein
MKMKHQQRYADFGHFMNCVAEYIEQEYLDLDLSSGFTDDERYTIKNIVTAHYEDGDVACNAANNVMCYLRTSREWMEKNEK